MAYGLQITNPSDELVIDSEATGLFCIGKLTLQGSVVQPTGLFPSSTPGRLSGYSRYRISSTSQPVIALDLPAGKNVGLRSVTNLGSNVWEVEVHCGDTPDSDQFDTVEYQLDVWAFAPPAASPAGPYGLALYNSSGFLSYDFTAGAPMLPRAFLPGGTGATIPSLTRPVFIGSTPTDITDENFQGGNTWHVRRRRGCWNRVTTTVNKAEYTDQKYRYFSPSTSPLGVATGDVFDQPGFILEGSLLP